MVSILYCIGRGHRQQMVLIWNDKFNSEKLDLGVVEIYLKNKITEFWNQQNYAE